MGFSLRRYRNISRISRRMRNILTVRNIVAARGINADLEIRGDDRGDASDRAHLRKTSTSSVPKKYRCAVASSAKTVTREVAVTSMDGIRGRKASTVSAVRDA